MDDQLAKQLRFLREVKADGLPHTDRHLLDHLLGTRQLLLNWGCRPSLCDAGLFHSVYGTEHYAPQAIPLSMRDAVRRVIGDEAESLVWLFGIMHRDSFDQNLEGSAELSIQDRLTHQRIPLTPSQFEDLVTMTFANSLEAFPRCPWGVCRNIRRYLRRFRHLAVPPAQQAFDQIDAPVWAFWK